MSIRREQICIRVRAALCDLEMLAEGQAMAWDSEAIAHTKADGSAPQGRPGSIEIHIAALEEWCGRAESTVDRERKGSKPEVTPDELRYRILNDHVGRNAENVAEREGISERTVGDVRALAGLTRKYGKPREREPSAP